MCTYIHIQADVLIVILLFAVPPCTPRLRQEEVHAISGPDEFGEFYRRLKQVKDFHRRYPNEVEVPMSMEFMKLDDQRKNPPEELQSVL